MAAPTSIRSDHEAFRSKDGIYVADASELGIAPGAEWPTNIEVHLEGQHDPKQYFTFHLVHAGEAISWYDAGLGTIHLRVFND